MNAPHETPDRIIELMDELLDAAIGRYHDRLSDEVFTSCNVCGKWEDHETDCPVPNLIAWMSKTPGQH